ncbi:MAG TPA: 3-hydroxyacyl-CoA dehydrogenase NAD-binding domain-containing protein, partial [Thermoanaerobaculia bacterium]|nr:3-hydroxyacyl-CoA dehydrogenase NAD-binding domain-containing protein [Thermoanaerobaculia bacterium]
MPSAFTLEVGEDRLATLTFDLRGKKVNIFSEEVLTDLEQVIDDLATRDDIGSLILMSGKPGVFIAGADVTMIAEVTDPARAEEGSVIGHRVFAAWAALPFPTIAAIQGTCLGGGTEISLASTFIVASDRDDIRIGLPETKLGIIPAWGGCTRLPRRVGIANALDIILAGKAVRGRKALKIGLVDALLPDEEFLPQLREFALAHRSGKRSSHPASDLKGILLERNPLGRKVMFDQARKQTLDKTRGHYPAPLRAIEVIRTGIDKGMEAGFAAEERATAELATSAIAKNLIHVFNLMEANKRQPLPEGGTAHEVDEVAVLGAGIMGGGIAQLVAAQADLPVRLKDIGPGPLALGMEHASKLFSKQVERHRLRGFEARRKMALLRPTLDYSGFPRVDLVIEAVIEKLEIKQKVFAEVGGQVGEEATLASNTSSLSIDAIARDTPHPERVVGMHFFNPVHRMPLIEVITGARTSADATATVVAFSRRLGKTPIVVKDGPGFLVNRILTFTMAEALWLFDAGCETAHLDRLMTAWGLPMGPMTLIDEVGIDVAVKVAHILADAYPDRLAMPTWFDKLVEDDRLGAKNGRGFYRYEHGKRTAPDPAVRTAVGARRPSTPPSDSEIVDRLTLPMVNEAALCLAEGITASAAELDLAMILGTG